MNSAFLVHIFRFVICVLFQVLVFRQVTFGWANFDYIHVLVYPVFIMLLPIRTPQPILISLGFLIGITVDLFYHTPGVHAAAGVLSAFVRPIILKLIEPRGGYNLNDSPTMEKFDFVWFLIYSSSFLLIHLLGYFSMEVFTPVKSGEIILRSVFSFFASIVFILVYIGILKPRE